MAIQRTFLAVLAATFACLSLSVPALSAARSLPSGLPSVSGSEVPRAAAPADDLDQLQARFDRENDGGRKVKLLKKLAEAQIDRERAASQAGDFKTVGLTLEKYRDNIKAAFDALKRTHPNPVKKPGGYKRLEFENQKALREVSDVYLVAPDPYKPPLQIVLADLRTMEDELLRALFPNRPGEKPLPPDAAPPASSAPPQEGEQNP